MKHTKIEIIGNLLTVTIKGNLLASDVIAVVTKQYPNPVVKNVIWDFTEGTVAKITKQGFTEIAGATLQVMKSGARQGGKTAYVGLSDTDFGLMRMYSSMAEMAGIPINYSVFRTLDAAMVWIND